MGFVFFMFGVGIVLFGLAWGLVAGGFAIPYVLLVCLMVAGAAIKIAVSHMGTGDDRDSSGQAKRIEDQREFHHRRRTFQSGATPGP